MFNKERKTKYAIRKLAVATVSLAIGTTAVVPAIVDSGQIARAEEQGGGASQTGISVTYEFENESPEVGELPDGVKALLPVDNRKYQPGEVVQLMRPTQREYKDPIRGGKWVYRDNWQDYFNAAADITIKTGWYYSNVATVTYKFESATPGKELPSGINNIKPEPKEYPRNQSYNLEETVCTLFLMEYGYGEVLKKMK